MPTDNYVVISGNVTGDPEMRVLDDKEQTMLVSFSIALTTRGQDKDGKWIDLSTSFIRCTAWRALAENISESVHKGDRVTVIGHLRQHSWETDTGDKRSAVEVTVDEIGPSLKWAVTTQEKVKRSNGNGNGNARAEDAPAEAKAEKF